MQKSIHYWNIHKQATLELWETMSKRDRRSITEGDFNQENSMAKWFADTVNTTADIRYKDAEYQANDPYTFKFDTGY